MECSFHNWNSAYCKKQKKKWWTFVVVVFIIVVIVWSFIIFYFLLPESSSMLYKQVLLKKEQDSVYSVVIFEPHDNNNTSSHTKESHQKPSEAKRGPKLTAEHIYINLYDVFNTNQKKQVDSSPPFFCDSPTTSNLFLSLLPASHKPSTFYLLHFCICKKHFAVVDSSPPPPHSPPPHSKKQKPLATSGFFPSSYIYCHEKNRIPYLIQEIYFYFFKSFHKNVPTYTIYPI